MLHSILLLGSCYNKHKKISMLFTIALIINLLIVQLGHVKISFLLCNIAILTLVSLLNKRINNHSLKFISSSFSILIWSVTIDIVCYYMFPLFNSNLNLFSYIMNGILFNLKYGMINAMILVTLNAIEFGFKYIKNKITNANYVLEKQFLKE